MPGYRPLENAKTTREIEIAASADELSREGKNEEAIVLLRALISELEDAEGTLPSWPYGRLAFTYRRLARYSDEVELLERYIHLQPDEAQAVRFNARLSKAQALLSKKGKSKMMPLRSDRVSTIRCWQSTVLA